MTPSEPHKADKEPKGAHEHKFDTPVESTVTMRRYVKEDGKTIPDTITAIDTLKLWKCKCGVTRAYNLERKMA
jgi:hypothetical protein